MAERRMSLSFVRAAAIACIVGALITAIGGAASQIARGSTAVSEEAWSYPWTPGTFVALTLVWAVAHALIFIGLLGVRGSGAAGPRQAARVGLALALAATALLFLAELASIPFARQEMDDSGPATVGGLFGVATVLTAVGLILAGYATIRAGRWGGWRRLTPLIAGIWSLVLVGLVFTDVASAAIGIYGLCFLALGAALYTEPSPGWAAARGANEAAGATARDRVPTA